MFSFCNEFSNPLMCFKVQAFVYFIYVVMNSCITKHLTSLVETICNHTNTNVQITYDKEGKKLHYCDRFTKQYTSKIVHQTMLQPIKI